MYDFLVVEYRDFQKLHTQHSLKKYSALYIFIKTQELPHWNRNVVHLVQHPVSDSSQHQVFQRKVQESLNRQIWDHVPFMTVMS